MTCKKDCDCGACFWRDAKVGLTKKRTENYNKNILILEKNNAIFKTDGVYRIGDFDFYPYKDSCRNYRTNKKMSFSQGIKLVTKNNRIKKIILTGSHNIGKTTTLEYFKNHPKVRIFNEMIRELSLCNQFNFKPYDDDKNYTKESLTKYFTSEIALFHFYCAWLETQALTENLSCNKDKIFLYDRFLIDTAYYSKYFFLKAVSLKLDKESLDFFESVYMMMIDKIKDYIKRGYLQDTLILVLEPLVCVDDDGFRLGEEEQLGVHETALDILNELSVKYKLVSADKSIGMIKVYTRDE